MGPDDKRELLLPTEDHPYRENHFVGATPRGCPRWPSPRAGDRRRTRSTPKESRSPAREIPCDLSAPSPNLSAPLENPSKPTPTPSGTTENPWKSSRKPSGPRENASG
jgi:hypothetical protein